MDTKPEHGDQTNESNKEKRHPPETPRDKPVEEEADKDVKNGG